MFLGSCKDSPNNNLSALIMDKANYQKVTSFFSLDSLIGTSSNIYFYSDEEDNYPIRKISIDNEELSKSLSSKNDIASILFLNNPAESAINVFYKNANNNSIVMIESKPFPDSTKVYHSNNDVLITEFFWNYKFSSNLENVRQYIFYNVEEGIYKYSYGCSGKDCSSLEEILQIIDNGFVSDGVNGLSEETILHLLEVKPIVFNKVSIEVPR